MKMTPERFRQVRNLFEASLEKAPADRAPFLNDAAQSDPDLLAHVNRMLLAHEAKVTFLDGSDTAPAELRTDPRRMEGRRLGPYEILREIGRGGMGTVYLARRSDGLFEQQVAIKVVTPDSAGRDVIERFEQERAILASLEHPNIARLYDGGSTEDGWPYFVMEYVNGKPIDLWCDERKLNITDRIRLFRSVCDAVHYALEHRVIHRDLKPGNILVTDDGTVKLLDFGIAKLVHVDPDQRTAVATRTGMRLMTPEYASPEQIRAEEITPLTDLYSLGVILYELVTGRRPYRLKSRVFHEIVRVVCDVPPTRPSSVVTEIEERPGDEGKTITIAPGLLSQTREGTPSDLKRRLSGDLDGILLKALEKDPHSRYRSVDQFRMDLDRHLNNEPVLAAASSRFADLARIASRYRVSIVLILASFLAVLTGAITVDYRGVALIVGAAALLGIWHIVTDKALGARISEWMHHRDFMLSIFLGIVVLLLVEAWHSGQISRMLLLAVSTLGFLSVCTLLFAWFVRTRWAGSLVASIRLDHRQRATGVLAYVLTLNCWRALTILQGDINKSKPDLYTGGVFLLMVAVFVVYVWKIVPIFEVRDRGLLYRGQLISWLNIERYEWEASAEPGQLVALNMRPDKSVLRLHVSRLFSIFPPIRITVPKERQEELETILRRHLSEWPHS
jgi:serine/threonine protein kinase